jgi:segregation and condensation protein B
MSENETIQDHEVSDADGQAVTPDENVTEESTEEPGAVEAADLVSTESIIEAMLMATDSPLPAARMARIVGDIGAADVKQHIAALNDRYETSGSSFRIEEIARGYQMLTLPEFNVWLRKLLKVRSDTKLTSASLEALAVVAYQQPAMRAEVEEIRGVGCGEVLQRLREMNLVKIVGRAEVIGRPLLYGTTKRFLEVFGLPSLAELPKVEALTPPGEQKKAPVASQKQEAEESPAPPESTEEAPDAPVENAPAE